MTDNLDPQVEGNQDPTPAAEPQHNFVNTDPLSTTDGDPVVTTTESSGEFKPLPPTQPGDIVKGSADKWYSSLPEDLRDNPNIQKFKGPEGLAKSYLELSTLLGHEKVPIPKDENDLAAIAHLDKVRGVPEDPKGYELKAPEAPQGLEEMTFGMDEFKAFAHKHKLTPAQAQGVMNDYTEMLGNIQKQSQDGYVESIKQTKNELMKEWGLAYDTKVKLAQSVMNKFAGSKEEFDAINAKIGADPVALKWLAKVGDNFKEGSLGDMGSHTSSFTKTPAEAKGEYDKIMNDPNDIYWSGVRNNQIVSESVRKERISYVESLLKMQQPAKTSQ